MLRKTSCLSIAAALVLMLGGPVALGDTKGGGDRPAGWDKGKKEGWQGGNVPPGLEKRGGTPPGLKKKQDGGAKDGGAKETAEKKPDAKAKETAPATVDKKDAGGKPEKKKKEKKEKKQKDAAPK